jgi:hypothetical protein
VADNSNTLQLTLQVKDDGTIVIDKAVGKIKDLEGQTQKGEKGLGSFSEGWVGITAKITGFIAAGYGAYKMLESFVSEAAEAEAIENRLKFALESTGYSWNAAKSAVDEFAQSIQATTRFSDEQARQSLTDMMMYTQDFGKAQMGAKLAMDMSIRTGQDLGSTNRLIGMAMSGNVEMLGRYIPELRNLDNVLGANATQAQKAEYALKILNQKFSGTAQADLDSYSGKVAQFKNQWIDLKEEIGGKTLPVLGNLLKMLTKISQHVTLGIGGGTEKAQLEFQSKMWKERYENLKDQPGFEAEILEAEEKIWVIEEKLAYLSRQEIENKAKLAAQTKKDIFPESKMKAEEIEKDILAFNMLLATAEKLSAEGKMPSWLDSIEEHATPVLRDITELDLNLNKIIADAERLSDLGEMPSWLDTLENLPKGVAIKEREEDFAEGIENARLLHQAWLEEYTKTNEVGETLAKNMASAWNFNLKNIISDSKNMGDAVKKVFLGMGDAFTSAISKMISDWMLFGSITGKYESGKGIIGWLGGGLGGLFGGGAAAAATGFIAPVSEWSSMVWLQHGADFWADKPTIIGVGERGRERVTVTPESKMSRGEEGKTIINAFYIYALDAQSFREFVRKNPEAIIEVVNRDARVAGPMSKLGS